MSAADAPRGAEMSEANEPRRRWVVVAIDGPAASGKGTIARRLARRFSLRHLDTGLLYRGTAWLVLEAGADPGDLAAAVTAAEAVDADVLGRDALRSGAVGAASSIVAAHGAVRETLLARQRAFARGDGAPPHLNGAVLDGRDIASVVCPEADAKLFVDAAIEERARRRAKERGDRGEPAALEVVLADLRDRDRRDRERADAPMRRLPGVPLLDTTELGIDAAVEEAAALIRAAAPWLEDATDAT